MQPFYPFFWGDYSAKTFDLSMEEHGAYILLLRYVYTENKPIENEHRFLIGKAQKKREKMIVDRILNRFFVREGNLWRNRKAEEVISESNLRHERRSKAGALGGRAKAEKQRSGSSNATILPEANGVANGKQCSANHNHNHISLSYNPNGLTKERERDHAAPDPSPPSENLKKGGGKKKRDASSARAPVGTPIPADWDLSEAMGNWAESEIGWSPDRIISEADKFASHYRSLAGEDAIKADWDAAWQKWCQRGRDYDNKRQGRQS